MNFKSFFIITIFALGALWSCKTPQDVAYFQDATKAMKQDSALNAVVAAAEPGKSLIQPGDKLNIVVSSAKTPDLAMAYNKVLAANTLAGKPMYEQNVAPYIVNAEGFVIFPELGVINLKGLSRSEAGRKIQKELRNRQLLNDAVVTVEVMNQFVSVLGEVGKAGRVNFDRDQLTIVEAIARCGDLNINANRKEVLVLRKENNKVKAYSVDMTEGKKVWQSPVYHLQVGDVVYAAPNKKRMRESDAYGNTWHQPYIYFSLISVLTSVISLIIAL